MDKQQQRRTLEVFESLLDWPAEDRAERAVTACQGDEVLLAAVQRMIAIDASAAALLPTAPPDRMRAVEHLLEPPTRFGNFRVDGLLGRGGMGEVWRGVRDDGVFEQQVAIKTIWPGLVGPDAIHWFDAERRILARLQHPAVARILDGGTDDMGRAYFVMELVEGEPIDQYVREHALDARQVARLMVQVCKALEYAHRQLVVHADLKPSNISIMADGRPKLLDFGIARLLSDEARHWTSATTGSGAPLTRRYASPQRQGGALPSLVDDLYSLGVILRELLCGQPGDSSDLAAAAAPADADLAAIVSRATDPDAEHRYGSVAELREELQRYLGRYPVQARGTDWPYATRRFIERHRLGVSLSALALLALVAATVVMAVLYARAEAARRDSVQRFEEVRSLAKYMLFDLDARLEATPGTTEARREMTGRSQSYLDALGRAAGDDLTLQREVAVGLARLAEVQGVPGRAHVGEPEAARANLQRAEGMLTGLLAQQPASGSLQRDLGQVKYLLALVYGGQDADLDRQLALAREAEALLLEAHETASAWVTDAAVQADLETLVLGARLTQADALSSKEDYAGAASLQQSEERRVLALPEPVRAAMDFAWHSGRPALLLGDSLYYLERKQEAVEAYRRAAARFEAGLLGQPGHRRLLNGTLLAYWSMGATLDELGGHSQALVALDRALAVGGRLRDLDPANHEAHRMYEVARSQRAVALAHLGRYDEAIASVEQGIAEREARAALAPDDAERVRDTAVPLRSLAAIYREKGDQTGACRVLRRAERAWLEVGQRFGLSPRDERIELGEIRAELARCG